MPGDIGALPNRFTNKFIPVPESGCWIWTAHCSEDGYGTFRAQSYKMMKAHRYSFEALKWPIPLGLQLDHLCRVRCCVNPDHLEIVDNRTNCLRGYGPTSLNAKKTHCKYGHEFTQDNTGPQTSGGRSCRICSRRIKAAYKKRKKMVDYAI